MAGRQYSSLVNDVYKTQPLEFRRDGAATVAALAGSFTNKHNVPLEVLDVTVTAGTAPAGSPLIADVLIDGTTVFAAAGDRARVNAGSQHGDPTAPTKTGDAIVLAPGQALTAAITQIGSGTAGSDVVVQVRLGRHGRQ